MAALQCTIVRFTHGLMSGYIFTLYIYEYTIDCIVCVVDNGKFKHFFCLITIRKIALRISFN